MWLHQDLGLYKKKSLVVLGRTWPTQATPYQLDSRVTSLSNFVIELDPSRNNLPGGRSLQIDVAPSELGLYFDI